MYFLKFSICKRYYVGTSCIYCLSIIRTNAHDLGYFNCMIINMASVSFLLLFKIIYTPDDISSKNVLFLIVVIVNQCLLLMFQYIADDDLYTWIEWDLPALIKEDMNK